MANVLVKINNRDGRVSFECNIETSAILTTTFQWYETDLDEGFQVVEDSIEIFKVIAPGIKLPMTEIASEIFLLTYLAALCEFHNVDAKNVTYIADAGIGIKTLAFIPPTITRDEQKGDILCREFPEIQAALRDVWMDYKSDGNMLCVEHIQAATGRDVLEDFISLINLQTILNFGELENNYGIPTE